MSSIDESIKISNVILKNRLLRSATAEAMSDEDGCISKQYMRLYEKLAKGGASLIITGHIFAERAGRASK